MTSLRRLLDDVVAEDQLLNWPLVYWLPILRVEASLNLSQVELTSEWERFRDSSAATK